MIPILYGSQSGNGVFLANELKKVICNSFVLPLDNFDLVRANEFPLIIFICSTHGDGQPPFNMAKFYNFIQAAERKKLKIFNFKSAILGLGDSSYQKYNYCARILGEKLKAIGSEIVCRELANSQDTNGMYDGFIRFKNFLIENFDFNANKDSQSGKSSFGVPLKSANSDIEFNIPFIKEPSYKANVVSNELVTASGYADRVYELVLHIPTFLNFIPGDCLSILPKNTIDFSSVLAYENDQMDFLREKVDLVSVPHQPIFKVLASFTDVEVLNKKLLEISEDFDLYHSYVVVPRRNILEIVKDFSLTIPFEFFIEYNRIQPRYYSFSMIETPNGTKTYHILYNIAEYNTYLTDKRTGLCSHYMMNLQPGQDISVGHVKSSLFLNDKKLLFFATGTGVTLPRSVANYFKDQSKEIVVFYGFRYHEKDKLCASEFETCKSVKIHYASSRDDRNYIMDLYRKNPVENIDEWLVYVSGNCRLNKEIKKLLEQVHGKSVVFQSETW